MAGNIKGITVEIGGDSTGLQKALQEPNKQASELQGELKLVDKALKLDPSNLELIKQKQDLLKDSITSTEEKLKILKDVQKQVKEQYSSGQIDGGQYAAFQLELTSTKKKLEDLKEQKKSVSVIGTAAGEVKEKLTELNDKLEPITTGLKNVGKAAGDIAVGGVKTVGTAVDIAGKGFTAYTAALTGAGTAAITLTAGAAGAADDINTLATQTGLSTDQIQKFQYASSLIDVDLETMTGSMAKLTKNMDSAKNGSKAQTEAFKALGVSVTDNEGKLRSNQDVFNETIAALGKIENGTERDALSMKIFGKSAQELNPLILGGADALAALSTKAEESGLILSGDALGNLNSFNDSLDLIKANAGASGNVLAGSFAESLTGITSLIGEAIPSITSSVAGLFSGENIAETQAKLTEDIISLGSSIITDVGTQLPQMVDGFNAIIIAIVTALITLLPETINTILPTLMDGFFALINGLLPMVPDLLLILLDAGIKIFTGLMDGINVILPQLMDMMPELIQKVTAALVENLPIIISGGMQLLTSLIIGITNSIPELVQCVIALIPVIVDALVENLPALIEAGIELIVALAQGLPQAIPEIVKAIPRILSAIIDTLMETDWLQVGGDIIGGIIEGLLGGIGEIGKAVKELGGNILKGFTDFFDIHSPSRVMRKVVGKNIVSGVTDELKSGTTDAERAAVGLSQAILSPFGRRTVGGGYGEDPDTYTGGGDIYMDNKFYVTDKATAEYAANAIGRKVRGRGNPGAIGR